MATFYKAGEIVGIAVEIERRGNACYRRLAAAADPGELRELFGRLAAEAGRNETVFRALLDRLGDTGLPPLAFDEDYAQYVAGLIASHALFSGREAGARTADPADARAALRLAMAFEKDSLLFLVETQVLVPEAERPVLGRCMWEARRHLARLQTLYARG